MVMIIICMVAIAFACIWSMGLKYDDNVDRATNFILMTIPSVVLIYLCMLNLCQ